ncbi:hypothetical protein P5624_14705 [Bacillus subtilis]|nr:hypothetical protein P5624_14705 [Bacillus subtilis]
MKRNIELQKEILLFLEKKEDIKPLPIQFMNLPVLQSMILLIQTL